jgi:cohesin loading factor subunit SCC2
VDKQRESMPKVLGKDDAQADAAVLNEILYQILINHLNELQSLSDDTPSFAKHLQLAQMVTFAETKDAPLSLDRQASLLRFCVAHWNKGADRTMTVARTSADLTDTGRTSALSISFAGLVRLSTELGARAKRQLSRASQPWTQVVFSCLNDSSAAFRAKVVGAVAEVLQADPNILADESVRKAIQLRLQDTSKSVREAVTALIGTYIAHTPEFTNYYYKSIEERLEDIGVSVRKRAVKILRSICLNHFQAASKSGQGQLPQIYTDISAHLIKRIRDEEEGVVQLVTDTFEDMSACLLVLPLRFVLSLMLAVRARVQPMPGARPAIISLLLAAFQRAVLPYLCVCACGRIRIK